MLGLLPLCLESVCKALGPVGAREGHGRACLRPPPTPAPDGAAWEGVPASNAGRCRKEPTCGTS